MKPKRKAALQPMKDPAVSVSTPHNKQSKQKATRILCMLLALFCMLALLSCGKKETPSQESSAAAALPAPMRIAAMTGPTGMGLAPLLDAFGASDTLNAAQDTSAQSAHGGSYQFLLAGTADEITPRLLKGELDAACVPANLASVLYNKTEGEIITLAINTLGVLYVVDTADSVHTLSDLAGKTVVSAGKGSVPEYVFRYLLTQNGLDPDRDLTVEWKSEQSECVAALASGAAQIAVMPQPYVTVAQSKIEGLHTAISLTEEWEKAAPESALLTGVVVVRKAFASEHPEAIAAFLADYEDSVLWTNTHIDEAAEIIGTFNIVPAAVAKTAIPDCNIVCITGAQMKPLLSGYLQILAQQDAQSVGGKLPEDDFYYNANG